MVNKGLTPKKTLIVVNLMRGAVFLYAPGR